MALEPDYDDDPVRFRLAREVLRRHATAPDVHERVAKRFAAEGLLPVLDVGCGEGELARHLPAGGWTGLDASARMLARAPEPSVLGDATRLPFADASFGSVALLYMLYHVDEPSRALAEARRVLRPGGLVAVAAPSRHDSPELAHALPEDPDSFVAEHAESLLEGLFEEVEVESWDAPLVELPDRGAVRDYLVGKGTKRGRAEAAARGAEVPLQVTKRGSLCFGRAMLAA